MFITLEGPEGGGKTSHIQALVEFLCAQGIDARATCEPGGTSIGDQVRDVLKNTNNVEMHPRTEILLFCAARAQLVEQVIVPGLADGVTYVSDRYADSTLAYQGYGHGVDLSTLRSLLNFATGGRWPDLTFLLDIPTEAGLDRKRLQKMDWNRFEEYELDFHRRVRSGYLELARQDPQRWRIIDALQPWKDVQAQMQQAVAEYIKKIK